MVAFENLWQPFTKVHGYSGNDNIVLREGNEIALGYGGNDTIEGGAVMILLMVEQEVIQQW